MKRLVRAHLLVTVALCVLVSAAWWNPLILQMSELKVADWCVRLAGSGARQDGALIVTYDERDATVFPDLFMALLGAMDVAPHAAAVGINIHGLPWNDVLLEKILDADNVYMSLQIYSTATAPEEVELARDALRSSLAAFRVASEDYAKMLEFPLVLFPYEGFLPHIRGAGFNTLLADLDGVSRRLPLVVRHGDHAYASPALLLARHAMGRADEPIRIGAGGVSFGEVTIPARRGIIFPIVFSRNRASIERIPFRKFMEHRDSAALVRDRILIFSDIRPSRLLRVNTPVAPAMDNSEVIAQAALNIVNGRFATYAGGAMAGGRGSHLSTRWRSDAIIAGLAAALALFFFYLVSIRLAPLAAGGISFVGFLLAAALLGWLWATGWEVPLLLPAAGAAFGWLAGTIQRFAAETAQRQHVRSVFARYLARNVLERVLSDPELMKMGGRREELTVLFADIRNFTSLAETRSPDEVVRHLNRFYTVMVEVIFRHEGTLDKLMGDAVMVFFGDPVRQPDHAVRALRCAIEMQEAMRALEAELGPSLGRDFKVGIGVNTGEVLVGNLGSLDYIDYTVIGDAVNLASRLEHAAAGGQILVGEATARLAGDAISLVALPALTVKGKERPVAIWEVEPAR